MKPLQSEGTQRRALVRCIQIPEPLETLVDCRAWRYRINDPQKSWKPILKGSIGEAEAGIICGK